MVYIFGCVSLCTCMLLVETIHACDQKNAACEPKELCTSLTQHSKKLFLSPEVISTERMTAYVNNKYLRIVDLVII